MFMEKYSLFCRIKYYYGTKSGKELGEPFYLANANDHSAKNLNQPSIVHWKRWSNGCEGDNGELVSQDGKFICLDLLGRGHNITVPVLVEPQFLIAFQSAVRDLFILAQVEALPELPINQ